MQTLFMCAFISCQLPPGPSSLQSILASWTPGMGQLAAIGVDWMGRSRRRGLATNCHCGSSLGGGHLAGSLGGSLSPAPLFLLTPGSCSLRSCSLRSGSPGGSLGSGLLSWGGGPVGGLSCGRLEGGGRLAWRGRLAGGLAGWGRVGGCALMVGLHHGLLQLATGSLFWHQCVAMPWILGSRGAGDYRQQREQDSDRAVHGAEFALDAGRWLGIFTSLSCRDTFAKLRGLTLALRSEGRWRTGGTARRERYSPRG